MKKQFPFIVAIIGIFLLYSCEDETTYERPIAVEFAASSTTTYDNIAGIEIKAQMDGVHQATDVNVTFDIDAASTAVSGTHYAMNTNGTFAIPAQSSFGYVNMDALWVPSGETKTVEFVLTGGDFPPREVSKTHTVTIVGPVVELDETEAEAYDTLALSLTAKINLDGTPRNTAQDIGFTIDPASTAVAGVHYNMVTTGTDVTIPANADETEIAFDLIAGSMTTTSNDVQLIFNLNNTGDLVFDSEDGALYTFTFLAPKVEFEITELTVANNAGEVKVPLALIGHMASIDRTITFEVDAESTATEGDQFDLMTPSPIHILANTNSDTLRIDVLDGLTSINKDLSVTINLLDTGDLGVGNNGSFTLTIEAPE